MASLSEKLAEARRQEQDAASAQQQDDAAKAATLKREQEFNELLARFKTNNKDITEIAMFVFQVREDGTRSDNFDLDEFNPDHAVELINAQEQMLAALTDDEPKTRRLLFASKQKDAKTVDQPTNRRSFDPRNWNLFQWLPAVLGVFVALGIANATREWFVQDYVKASSDYVDLLTFGWVVVWVFLGFFGGLKVADIARGRYGSSD